MPISESVGTGKPNNPADVKHVQELLKKWPATAGGTPGIVVDSAWGNETKTAIEKFQTFHGLGVDGIVDPANAGGAAIVRLEAADIEILLTFDDGPHAQPGNQNNTYQIVEALKSNSTTNNIVAAFFIQTHSKAGRLGESRGKEVIKLAYDAGCPIEIHTGSTADHAMHPERAATAAYDVTGDDKPDGQNGLESDLIRAKARINEVVGTVPKYVRAVGLNRGQFDCSTATVDETYQRVSLKHIGVNVDSKDNAPGRPSPDVVKQTLTTGDNSVANAIQAGKPHMIVLFHDVNGKAADNIDAYIATIAGVTGKSGRFPKFIKSRADALAILSSTTE